MALPPKDMHEKCLRCGAPLAADVRICEGCGADREIELALAAELDPAIASLRRWLLVLAAIACGFSALTWEHHRDTATSSELWAAIGPTLLVAAVLVALAALARKAPLVVSLVALGLYGLLLVAQLLEYGWVVFTPSLGLVLRFVFLIVLVGAVQSGLRARRIRARLDQVPRAVVRRG